MVLKPSLMKRSTAASKSWAAAAGGGVEEDAVEVTALIHGPPTDRRTAGTRGLDFQRLSEVDEVSFALDAEPGIAPPARSSLPWGLRSGRAGRVQQREHRRLVRAELGFERRSGRCALDGLGEADFYWIAVLVLSEVVDCRTGLKEAMKPSGPSLFLVIVAVRMSVPAGCRSAHRSHRSRHWSLAGRGLRPFRDDIRARREGHVGCTGP